MESLALPLSALSSYPSSASVPYRADASDRDDIDHMLDMTYMQEARKRASAVRQLCLCHLKMNDRDVWDRLLAMVTDDDATVRGHVVHVLADGSLRRRLTEVVTALETLWHDPDLKIRRRVRRVLATYQRTGNVNSL